MGLPQNFIRKFFITLKFVDLNMWNNVKRVYREWLTPSNMICCDIRVFKIIFYAGYVGLTAMNKNIFEYTGC